MDLDTGSYLSVLDDVCPMGEETKQEARGRHEIQKMGTPTRSKAEGMPRMTTKGSHRAAATTCLTCGGQDNERLKEMELKH